MGKGLHKRIFAMTQRTVIVYESSKIWKKLAHGGDHTVYAYGENQVIKFSLLFRLLGSGALEKAIRDIETCCWFFGDYMVETKVATSLNSTQVAYIQPKIVGRPLAAFDLRNSNTMKQFREIIHAHRTMKRIMGTEIDFVGAEGFVGGYLSNVFVTHNGMLRIIDATVMDVGGYLWPAMSLVRNLVIWRQEAIIENLLKIEARS
jgi:hypothetical protein